MSSSFITHTLNKLNISNEYTTSDLVELYSYFKTLISSISENKVICEEFELENGKKDFCLQIAPKVLAPTATNSFIDEFYFEKENVETFISYRNNVLKLILSLLSKYNKKLVTIQEKINECKDMDKYKLYGELITSNLYKINNNINIDNIVLENYYDNNKQVSIPLDKKISPSLNAKKYFKKYNKLKSTLNIVTTQRIEIKSEIDYLESIVYALENSTSAQDINEIHQEIEENILKVPTMKTFTNKKDAMDIIHYQIDGFNVYVGKNNTQNDMITFKMSDKNDLWFHVQGFHGSHVLLKTNGKEISDESPILLKCAKLAALHSKACSENKVLVDYTLVKNLKKPKGSKPGFVVFNNHKTIIVDCN